jgi:hypothetical protein
MYIPGENVAVDKSLTLWKGRLSFKIYLPLKSSKFGIKTFKLCESSTGSLWKYIVYSGADTDINTAVDFCEKNKTTAIVAKLIETLLNKRSRGSSVSIVCDCRMDDQGSIPNRGRGFFL